MNLRIEVPAAEAPRWVHWLGTDYRIALSIPGGPLGAFETRVAAAGGPPLHVHHAEDEAIHVIEGEIECWMAGTVGRCVPGQSIFLPRGVPHTFRVTSAGPARLLGIVTPGGFEGFFAAAAAGDHGPQDPVGLAAFAHRWSIEFLGPSPLNQ